MVHEGIRKHICDYPECANKLFPAGILLRKHIDAVHKGIKNCICDECGKPFYDKYWLEKHKSNIHDGKPKYKCDFKECKESFEKLNHLINHKKTGKNFALKNRINSF